MHAKSPLAIREVIRTERPGGSAFVQLFPPAASSHATETMTDPMASRPVIDPQVVEALVRGRARVRASARRLHRVDRPGIWQLSLYCRN